jgi:hypothetical protein
MANSVYPINKGINRPIEFKGLKAQYIGYLGIGLVALLVLFAILYILGLNTIICLMIILSLGSALFMTVYRLSHRYGQYGIMKALAKKRTPDTIKSYTRRTFLLLGK